MQKKLVVASVFCLTLLGGCVSESTIVNTDRVGAPRTDMKEAARTRISLGLNYLQRGDMSQAKFNLEKAKQLAPDLSDVDNAMAYYFQQVGEFEQAEDAYRASLRKDSNNADTYNNFGSFLCQINKFTEAEELLQAAIKRPGYIRVADSYENLAFCALAQKDYLRYQQFLRQSLQHNSNRTSSLYNMAVIEYAMGNLSEAKKWQGRLHQLGQVSPEATLIRYLVAYQSGDVVEQQTAEKFLLSVYPGSSEAAMLLSGDFSQSKPEQMKQAYKATLITSSDSESAVPDQPKVKIVKRKSSASTAVSMAASSVQTPSASVSTEAVASDAALSQRPRDELSDLPSEAEDVQSSSEVTAALTPVEALPEELPKAVASTAVETSAAEANQVAQNLTVAATEAVEPPEATLASEVDDASAAPSSDISLPEQSQTTQNAVTAVLTHKVGAGDTLYSIATRYGLTVPQLQQLNQLADSGLIVTGQVLRLSEATELVQASTKKSSAIKSTEPAPASYQIADGDSWFSISYKYNIKLDTLLKWNNMTADQPLSIGQTIYLRDPAPPSL
ncbi:MAG: type IV pilus biogenesis/stability protein PilW [Rheinheimera sp.]